MADKITCLFLALMFALMVAFLLPVEAKDDNKSIDQYCWSTVFNKLPCIVEGKKVKWLLHRDDADRHFVSDRATFDNEEYILILSKDR